MPGWKVFLTECKALFFFKRLSVFAVCLWVLIMLLSHIKSFLVSFVSLGNYQP